jgi:hypothetical protein
MRTPRTLEAEWRQVLRRSVSTGAKEDESNTGRVWAAGSHHVMARFSLGGHFETHGIIYFFNFPIFFLAAVNHR